MKSLISYLTVLAVAFGCSNGSENFTSYGEAINSSNPLNTEEFLSKVSTDESTYRVKGTIEEVCQMKGCWMTLKNDEGQNIRVTFKDYGFFVPKDISGKEVIIEGIASKEVLEEDEARHYADDSGKEYDESMRNTITFVASGVLVSNS